MENFQMAMVGFFSCATIFYLHEDKWGMGAWFAGLAIMNLIFALT